MVGILGFGILYNSAEFEDKRASKMKYWMIVLLAGLFLAALFETLQMIIPYRRFNINDMVANCLGVVIGLTFLSVFRKIRLWLLSN